MASYSGARSHMMRDEIASPPNKILLTSCVAAQLQGCFAEANVSVLWINALEETENQWSERGYRRESYGIKLEKQL